MTACHLLCLWLLSSLSPVPTSAPADGISVRNDAPIVDRVMFNRTHPPDNMPKLKPGEAALTQCDYECRAAVRYEILKRVKTADHWHAVVRIQHVDLQTRLTDTIFLPMMAPVLLRAHEEGHREMNERIYREADAVARTATADILSHTWEADGADPDAAAKAASDAAVQHACRVYLDATADRASRLGDIYDRLTDHGRNQLYVANAIRLSFLEERKATTQSGELLHPTTNAAR
jgi:hypothetical protein